MKDQSSTSQPVPTLSPPPSSLPVNPQTPIPLKQEDDTTPANDPDVEDLPTPLAKHFTSMKRRSISYWNTVKTELAQPKRSIRQSLRAIAPLRLWVTILLLVLLIISLLVWMVIKEDKAISSLTNTLDTVNADAISSSLKKSGNGRIIFFICFGAITSGVNGFFMWRMAALKQIQAKQAAAAAEALLARAPSTFLERRFPILNAILPGDPHEMILYCLNFIMIVQSVKVWQNWRHSPVAGAIRKWQSTRLNKMIRTRELRRIQRRAARELAKTQAAPAAATSTAAAAFALVTRGGAAVARAGSRVGSKGGGKLLFGSIRRLLATAISLIISLFAT